MPDLGCTYPNCGRPAEHVEFYWTGIPKPRCNTHASRPNEEN